MVKWIILIPQGHSTEIEPALPDIFQTLPIDCFGIKVNGPHFRLGAAAPNWRWLASTRANTI